METAKQHHPTPPASGFHTIHFNSQKPLLEKLLSADSKQCDTKSQQPAHEIPAPTTVAHHQPRSRNEANGSAEETMQGLLFRDARRTSVRDVQDPSPTQANGDEEKAEEHLDPHRCDAVKAASLVNDDRIIKLVLLKQKSV